MISTHQGSPTLRDQIARFAGERLNWLHGRVPLKFTGELEESQFWDREQLLAWQKERLLELLHLAHRHVPFYRQRLDRQGWPPSESFENYFNSLPVLTKDELRVQGDKLLTQPRRGLLLGRTSGTTGAPVKVWYDSDSESYMHAVKRRAYQWYGVEPNSPTFYFGGPAASRLAKLRQHIIDRAIIRRCVVAYDVSLQSLDGVIQQLRRFRPRIVTGYTSALYALAQRAEETFIRLDNLGVQLVSPISELCQSFHSEELARVFGAPVLTEYGCVEIGAMAYSCPMGNLHISHDHVFFEVINEMGWPAREGETGRVVLTPFLSRAMPLIRYELGDMAALEYKKCDCGRTPGLPFIKELAGRQFDQLVDGDNKRWHAIILYYTFKEVFDVAAFKEFQGIQSKPGEIHLLIVPGTSFSKEKADKFAKAISRRVSGPLSVTWERVDRIEREGAHKFKYFKSTVNALTV